MDRVEFNKADCTNALFHHAQLPYSDFSHAMLEKADFYKADLKQALLHRINDKKTQWRGSKRVLAEFTDKDLAIAENFKPPEL